MKRLAVVIACVSVPCILAAAGGGGNDVTEPSSYAVEIPAFRTASYDEADTAVNEAVQARGAVIDNLLIQLRDPALPNEAKVHIVYVLGQWRADKAVTALVDMIDLMAVRVDPKLAPGRWGLHPAQEALARIGRPSVTLILKKLGGENNELRRRLMCMVLIDVEGKGIAALRVQKVLEATDDPAQRANLEAALTELR
jgi:hypothetical protein